MVSDKIFLTAPFPEHWKKYTFEEIVEVKGGKTPSTLLPGV